MRSTDSVQGERLWDVHAGHYRKVYAHNHLQSFYKTNLHPKNGATLVVKKTLPRMQIIDTLHDETE